MKPHNTAGFSLIELMIVVAIVGILTMIAYPSYQSSVVQGHRSDAESYMMNLAQLEQQYFTDNRSYGTLTNLNSTIPSSIPSYYTITITPVAATTGTPPTYTITATAVNAQASATSNEVLTLDNYGNELPSGSW